MKLVFTTPFILMLIAAPLDAQRRAPARGEARTCGNAFAFQVLLDRNGYSPGVIDGQLGVNGSHALAAFQQSKNLPPTGQMDCASFEALGGASEATTTKY